MEWKCTNCTLLNPITYTKCTVCETSYNFEAALRQACEQSESDDPDHQLAREIMKAESNELSETDRLIAHMLSNVEIGSLSRTVSVEEKWACPRCTFSNSLSVGECEMCYQSYRTQSDRTLAALLEGDPSYMDSHSGAEFSALLGQYQYETVPFQSRGVPTTSARGSDSQTREVADRIMARELEASFSEEHKSYASLGRLSSHSENVHSREVEEVAIDSLDELLQRPLPQGQTVNDIIAEARVLLRQCPAGLPRSTAKAAVAALGNNDVLNAEFRGKRYRDVFAAVWMVAARHGERAQINRRIAEEVAEGAGTCNGGKIGRLVNSLRGFVNIGMHVTETGTGESFRNAFSARVLGDDSMTHEQKVEAANIVLDEYGITGPVRNDWLDAL